jgi:hypothetical protein
MFVNARDVHIFRLEVVGVSFMLGLVDTMIDFSALQRE